MMNQTITFEGVVRVEYSAGDTDRKILVVESSTPDAVAGESLANYVARQLGFPSEAEFDAMLRKLREQQVAGTYNADERDAERTGVQLRITIEVLNPGVGT
jgi:hypothetical protein